MRAILRCVALLGLTRVTFKNRLLSLPRRQKQLVALSADICLGLAATWLAFSLRLDVRHVPSSHQWLPYGLAMVLFVPFFIRIGLYRAIFRYSGVASLSSTALAVFLYGCLYFTVLLAASWPGVPRSIGILQPILFFILVFASRVIAAQMLKRASHDRDAVKNVLVYGAGQAGAQASEALAMSVDYRVRAFLDDDPNKQGHRIQGRPIYAPARAAEAIDKYGISDVLIAVPSADLRRRREIVDSLLDLKVRVRSIPGIEELARGDAQFGDVQELQIIDLLQRAPIVTQLPAADIAGRKVLVTGAGGSIGAELCRQIILLQPAELTLFDHSEYNLYAIDEELKSLAVNRAIATRIHACLGSIRDERRLDTIFARHRPDLVYHAAAYKHVPLVESNPLEAAATNVLGTRNVARAAAAHGASRFLLISTDKAVRPTNVMGATKRLAEQIVQALAAQGGKTVYSMVRFGNVLGSSGSVVPLFRRQIAAGGPVTITDPEVNRYFMTIPEAVGLVLLSAQMAEGGEVFVLNMGEPVKIIDLARKMIRLAGRTELTRENPDGEIEISVVGLRPGEKLFEELLIGDDPHPTSNPHIMMARENFLPWQALEPVLKELEQAVAGDRPDVLMDILRRSVAGFQPNGGAGAESAGASHGNGHEAFQGRLAKSGVN
jgi:FlaA1/EpsC-like NDP-sugar epimerase